MKSHQANVNETLQLSSNPIQRRIGKLKFLLQLMAIGVLLMCVSCSDGDGDIDSDPAIRAYKGTQSPGDVWSWEFDANNSTFSASWDKGTFDDLTDDVSVEGTFNTLPSGFLDCSVTTTNQPTDVPVNTQFYAFEVPGIALLIKPQDGDLIAAAASGECSDVAGNYKFVKIAPGLDDNNEVENPLTTPAYGTITLTAVDGGFTITGNESSLDCANGGLGTCTIDNEPIQIDAAVTCGENGELTVYDLTNDETVAQGQFGDVSMVVDQGYGNGGAIGFKQTAAFNPSTELLSGETFTGLAYLPYNSDNDKVLPVQVTWGLNETDALIGVGALISNIETGAVDSDTEVTIDITDVPNDGTFSGGVIYPVGEFNIGKNYQGILVESGGRLMMVITTVNESDEPYTLVLVKK